MKASSPFATDPRIAGAAARLVTACLIVSAFWIVEALVTSGPISRLQPDPTPSIVSSCLFAFSFAVAVYIVSTKRLRDLPQDEVTDTNVSAAFARICIVLASALCLLALFTGAAAYNPMLGDESRNTSLLGFIWAPISIASVASLLARSRRLNILDWALVACVAACASLVGGRTVPAMILLMVALRVIFLPGRAGSLRPLSLGTSLAFGTIAAGAAIALSAVAASRGDGSSFSSANLTYYGYNEWPRPLQNLAATLGVIGESSRVAHLVTPETVPYPGLGLLLSDVLSFLPWFSDTVTEHTLSLYGAAGSVVFTSRPGGTAATFYTLLGSAGVALGAFSYGLILMALLRRTSVGGPRASAVFLVLMATFVIGIYGTGTPTALTLIAVVLAVVLTSVPAKRFTKRVSRTALA